MDDRLERQQAVGLCAECRFARSIRGSRSIFWLCERSRDDSTFARYPRLPIRSCRGFATAPDASSAQSVEPPGER
jgi:hypothetical protein